MNDDTSYISAFLQVFENKPQVFEQFGAVDALANLSQTISKMADKSDEEVADAIGEWCEEYPEITNEINLIIRKLEPKPIKKESQEPMLSNRYPSLPEYLKNRLSKSQPPRE